MAKNKIKTHQATKKRFKITGTGKVRHGQQGDNAHLKIGKSRAQKARVKGRTGLGSKTEAKKMKELQGA